MERKLWIKLYHLLKAFGNNRGGWLYSNVQIMAVHFWAVLHDRPDVWATDPENWPDDLRPRRLPSQATVSRRMRRAAVVELMTVIEKYLAILTGAGGGLARIIDGKPLAVSNVSKYPDAGYGRGAGGNQKGYKLHAVWSAGPMPIAWGLAPMNKSEKIMARHLIPDLPGGGYLLGDSQYDANPLYDLSAESGFQLVTKKTKDRGRGGLGHRRQAPGRLRAIELLKTPFGKALINHRNVIEGRFGAWVSAGGGLGPLPAWVRRFHRVRNWVQAKIIITAIRWLLLREKHMLALA